MARASGVIAVGGDIPAELLADPASRFPRVLLIRGATDDWYTAKKLDADLSALRARGDDPEAFTHHAGHRVVDRGGCGGRGKVSSLPSAEGTCADVFQLVE